MTLNRSKGKLSGCAVLCYVGTITGEIIVLTHLQRPLNVLNVQPTRSSRSSPFTIFSPGYSTLCRFIYQTPFPLLFTWLPGYPPSSQLPKPPHPYPPPALLRRHGSLPVTDSYVSVSMFRLVPPLITLVLPLPSISVLPMFEPGG